MLRFWAGAWASSERRCLPTSPEGISAAYLVPTACWPWGLFGTRRASENGKRRRRTKRVASRCGNSVKTIGPRNDAIPNGVVNMPVAVETRMPTSRCRRGMSRS